MSKPLNYPLGRPQSSVNLQSRQGTPDIPINLQEKRVSNLPISQNLDTLERVLNSLLLSISKYNPSITDAENLVKVNDELEKSIKDIITHQQSGLEIESLDEKSAKLDNDTKAILLGLSECRQKLTSLPSMSKVLKEKKQMDENKLKTDDLLRYAMKLAKFTTAPPTFDSGSIGPNNFIWPAEDSLRRGMLAMASLNADKLIGSAENNDKSNNENNEKVENTENENSSPRFERRGSFGASFGGDIQDDDDVMEDLDLFDPDEL